MHERLDPENCNKSKCKTCIFGETPLRLSEQRMQEITSYLVNFEASHICHTTNRTCYGALELQARILFVKGHIDSPSVESMLEEASKYIRKERRQIPGKGFGGKRGKGI